MTLEQKVQLALDLWETQNVASKHEYYHKGLKHRGKLRDIWVQKQPDVSWQNNKDRYAHPSVRQMDLVAEKDFAALVTDSFNEILARELLEVTDKVFDVAYAVVFRRFPKVMTLVQQYEFIDEWKECLPNTIGVVRQLG